jgi:ATP-binding cassette subfamily B protein
VVLLPPGDHTITADMGPLLLSSSNVEGLTPGAELGPGDRLRVLGRLPARLLARPEPWPPRAAAAVVVGRSSDESGEPAAELLEPEWIESPSALVPISQREALEDWYGRQWADGTFPHHRGSGELDEVLACLRMLARQFDLPFRRDVLRRVLADQLQRQAGEGLGPMQLAALCDLMGLRASLLELRPDQLPRLSPPALVWLEGHPRVLWQLGGRDGLLSDPRGAQRRLSHQDLGSWSPEGTLTVLAVERNAATPTSRFGLAWFWPALRQHKVILAQVLIASFFVQLFALLNPLLIQQIIDAVITQGNLSSLNVLGTLLVGLAIAQAVLGSLRTYLFSDTTNRIDIRESLDKGV